MNDPIVDEVRKYRDEHARRFDYDLGRICEDYRSKHAIYLERLKKMPVGNDEGRHTVDRKTVNK